MMKVMGRPATGCDEGIRNRMRRRVKEDSDNRNNVGTSRQLYMHVAQLYGHVPMYYINRNTCTGLQLHRSRSRCV